MPTIPHAVQALYKAAEIAAKRFGSSTEAVFDPCGLILNSPPLQGHYWCTPDTAFTFASTGGDGVHYSYLDLPNLNGESGPIVMTLPANDQLNYVVAETLDEFLGLGFYAGWFALEQIAYDPDWALEHFSSPDDEGDETQQERLKFLQDVLGIRHVPLDLERIDALTGKYADYLQVPLEPP